MDNKKTSKENATLVSQEEDNFLDMAADIIYKTLISVEPIKQEATTDEKSKQ